MSFKTLLNNFVQFVRRKKIKLKRSINLFFKQIKKAKRDKGLVFNIFKHVVFHFCYHTALHGYRFIALTYITLVER